ncbi:MAG: DUF4132 domain-containing protein [Clostridia bacterium]|nr:DUF4132 domain-containing protein [Clostridia bacterium]MBR2176741.1 DUF4132 domain-containing protein [Clostridia bacterium]
MDLLSVNNSTDVKVENMILELLSEAKLPGDIMQAAEKFFDFSKEADLSLLDFNIPDQIDYRDVSYGKRQQVYRKIDVNDFYKYSDRFILFLEALGPNAVFNMLGTPYQYFDYNCKEGLFRKRILHAFERKYGAEFSQAKLISLMAMSNPTVLTYQFYLHFTAKNDPRLIYQAGRICNHSSCTDGALKMYALVLSCTDPENNDEKLSDDKKLTSGQISEMISDICQAALSSNTDFDFTTPVLFMSAKHDERIKKLLTHKIQTKESEFLNTIFKNIPKSCFDKNIDLLIEILRPESSKAMQSQIIKTSIISALKGNALTGRNSSSSYTEQGHNAESLVIEMAKAFPKVYTEIMFSSDPIDAGSYYSSPKYFFNLYEELYRLLETFNPDAIKEYGLDSEKDMIKLAIVGEQAFTTVAKDEIEQYLTGQSDLSVLEPYFNDISDPNNYKEVGRYRTSKIINALENNHDFISRYIAFKTIQAQYVVVGSINDAPKSQERIPDIIKIIISEGVPLHYRFALYDSIYEGLYTDEDKKTVEEAVLTTMAEHSEELDDEYSACCLSAGVFMRQIYAHYLEKTNENDKNKDRIIAMCKDTSKDVRRTAAEIIAKHKEYEKEVIELLSAKKQTSRETAIDIFAMWGAANYREILTAAAEKEKSIKLRDKIHDILALASEAASDNGDQIFSPLLFVDDIHKGGRNKKVLWLYETQNPQVHFKNGNAADDKYMQAILLCYASMAVPSRNENAVLLSDELNEKELNRFASEIFSKWYSDGAESKKKWVLYFAAIHGGSNMIEVLLRCIKEWAENMRGAIAADAVRALAYSGTSEALMIVDNLAHKFKQKQVKKAAIEALDTAAEALGITADELGDRIVPDLGFNERMEQIFDYGTRKFKVYLTPTLDLEIYDENDKKLKTMPSPGKRDDEELAKKSNTEFKQMKKQLKNVISIQKMRLETALLADRRWKKAAWENLFVRNPVMHSFAIGLIWASYTDDGQVQTFRYMEDGSFNTSDEDEYELPENAKIGLVHPIDLDENTLSAWKEQLSDYEIIQPIEQLERKIYRITDEEKGQLDLNRFKGREINGMTLLGRTSKLGWYKGSPQDAGCFYEFYREDITERIKNADGTVTLKGNAAELHFEGMYIAGDDSEVTIENVRFYHPGDIQRGSYVYDRADDNKAIMLDKISPRYLSEIINQLELITKTADR